MFAERIIREGGDSVDQKIAFAYRTATARIPDPQVVAILRSVYESEVHTFADAPQRAKQLLSTGEKMRDKQLDLAEHAAWTIVASMLLNLDEVITRL